MITNGIIVQEYKDSPYRGIDGSGASDKTAQNWFLNFREDVSDSFEAYYDENIGKTYWNIKKHSRIAACNDMDYIYKYVREAEKLKIKYRMLLCETDVPDPKFECPDLEKIFLGYDYAYTSGDNYSAVYNEIPFVFTQFKLNKYGLFQTREEIEEYIAVREQFKLTHPPLTLEEGDFVIYRLHEVFLK
ncbi:MAG: hypothetical protein J6I46_03590 [Ruminococcus sp.]|nr:hypothetical protein [Ruminococcus sp.]